MAKRNSGRKIHVAASQHADVYLSGSWRDDESGEVPKELVRRLGARNILCVGDVKVGGDQDPKRIARIVNETSGLAVILPFRGGNDWQTSEFVWEEVSIAASQGIPVILFHDQRVKIKRAEVAGGYVEFGIPDQGKLKPVRVNKDDFVGPLSIVETDLGCFDAYGQEFDRFVELTTNRSSSRPRPFAFLSTRLKSDFAPARSAIASALDESLGLTCLWGDSPRYSSEIEGVYDRAKFLVKECQFAIVDLTFGPESPDYDSPSRAHEVGMAQAFEKEILATAQEPRREPYFSASMIQVKFWSDENELRSQVLEWANSPERVKAFGRKVYSYEVCEEMFAPLPFEFDPKQGYIAPNAFPLTTFERFVVAAGFALIALAISLLATDYLRFEDTFDFASIIAAVFTLVFASDMSNSIRLQLGRWAPLRWMIPAIGLVLLAVWAALQFAP